MQIGCLKRRYDVLGKGIYVSRNLSYYIISPLALRPVLPFTTATCYRRACALLTALDPHSPRSRLIKIDRYGEKEREVFGNDTAAQTSSR